jgi:hypothetical protein
MRVAALVLVALEMMVEVDRAVGRGVDVGRAMVTSPRVRGFARCKCFTPTKYLRTPRADVFGRRRRWTRLDEANPKGEMAAE